MIETSVMEELIEVVWKIKNSLDVRRSPPSHAKYYLKTLIIAISSSQLVKFIDQMNYDSKNIDKNALYLMC